jgi:RNA-binding protein
MPETTSPKKRALMPSSPLRRTLRAAGHHLTAIVQVGKEGVTTAVVQQLDEALRAHELVKVKVGTESPEDRFETAERLRVDAGAQVAQILGRTMLMYRRHPESPRFEPKPAGELRAAKASPVGRRLAKPSPRGERAARGFERKRFAKAGPERKRSGKPGAERKAFAKASGDRKRGGGKPSAGPRGRR